MSATPKKRLGRGLDSLLAASGSPNEDNNGQLRTVAVSSVRPSRFQARIHIDDDALHELAESIKAQGLIQPLIVREHGLDGYELIAGERRWRASQLAGLTEIPVIVKHSNDKAVMAMGLIENIQRQNLNPIEEARGFARLGNEFGLTHETIAEAVGRSRSAITNSLRLLNLPEPIQEMLFDRQLEMGHARALLTLPIDKQLDLAQQAVRFAWSVRETEKRSQRLLHGQPAPKPQQIDADIERISEALTEQLGVSAHIQTRNRKKGKIVLHFDSADAFEHLLARLNIRLPD